MINLSDPQKWEHHRHGWGVVGNELARRFHEPGGVRFFDWVDGVFRSRSAIIGTWSGFLHNVVSYPPGGIPGARILSLEQLVRADFFSKSLRKCPGVFTLSRHTRDFLRENTNIPVESLIHPGFPSSTFSWDKFESNPRVIGIGKWMRRWDLFASTNTGMPKFIVDNDGVKTNNITKTRRLSDKEYDETISTSIVFLDFYDVSACNTIIECIMSNTPVITRGLSANREYLGEDYPGLFHDGDRLEDFFRFDQLRECSRYLAAKDKSHFSIDFFTNQFTASPIYKSFQKYKIKIWT